MSTMKKAHEKAGKAQSSNHPRPYALCQMLGHAATHARRPPRQHAEKVHRLSHPESIAGGQANGSAARDLSFKGDYLHDKFAIAKNDVLR
jgi:hypothetical protein